MVNATQGHPSVMVVVILDIVDSKSLKFVGGSATGLSYTQQISGYHQKAASLTLSRSALSFSLSSLSFSRRFFSCGQHQFHVAQLMQGRLRLTVVPSYMQCQPVALWEGNLCSSTAYPLSPIAFCVPPSPSPLPPSLPCAVASFAPAMAREHQFNPAMVELKSHASHKARYTCMESLSWRHRSLLK